MNQLLSDKNCDRTKCNLQLGSSQAFILNASRRRLGLKYYGNNYLRHIFHSPNGEKIFQKCEERTKDNYPEVLSGERRTLVTSPPQFEYNSKIKGTSTVVEAGLEKIIAENNLSKNDVRSIYDYVIKGMHYGKPKSVEDKYYTNINSSIHSSL